MLRVLRRPDQLSVLGRSLISSTAVASGRSQKCDIPEGHQNSDLRSVTCHIGLNRRRDLSLREDLCLFQPGGKATVGEIFKVSVEEALQTATASPEGCFSLRLSSLGTCCWALWCPRHGGCLLREACPQLLEECKHQAPCCRYPAKHFDPAVKHASKQALAYYRWTN